MRSTWQPLGEQYLCAVLRRSVLVHSWLVWQPVYYFKKICIIDLESECVRLFFFNSWWTAGKRVGHLTAWHTYDLSLPLHMMYDLYQYKKAVREASRQGHVTHSSQISSLSWTGGLTHQALPPSPTPSSNSALNESTINDTCVSSSCRFSLYSTVCLMVK